MLKLDVVIPVMNQVDYTESLLLDIKNGSELPQSIIIIDNNSTDRTQSMVESFSKSLPIKYVRNMKNIGVNASWNLGVCYANHDLITFLNNDLVINKYFFSSTISAFLEHPNCAMIYPRSYQGGDVKYRVEYSERVRSMDRGSIDVEEAHHREGWAFTLRRNVALKVLIPKELFNYCGDDYIYHFVTKLGYKVLRMKDNYVYHYGNVTGGYSGLHKKMNEDTRKWHKIVKEDLETLIARAF